MRTLRKIGWCLAILTLACEARALDAIHVVTFSFRTTVEALPIQRGSTVIGRFLVLRATTRDMILALGDAKGIEFGPRAQLLLIRYDAGTLQETVRFVVREAGYEDVDVSDMMGVELGSPLIAGSVNPDTGLIRVRRLSISRLGFAATGQVTLDLSGVTTEINNSVLINRQQIDIGLTSLSASLAGNGVAHAPGADLPLIVQGLMRVGPPKLIASEPL